MASLSTVVTGTSSVPNGALVTLIITWTFPTEVLPLTGVPTTTTTHSTLPDTITYQTPTPTPETSSSATTQSTAASTLSSLTSGKTSSMESADMTTTSNATFSSAAVSSATNPSVSPTSSPAPSDRLGNGAVAGIAIACIVIGALLGAAAIFFLLRRRKSAPVKPKYTTVQHHDLDTKGGAASLSVPTVSDNLQLAHFLPGPVPDKELSHELQALGYLIQQHVENYYHLKPIPENSSSIARSLGDIAIGEQSPVPASQLAPLALEPQTRYATLQHVISTAVFSSLVSTSRTTVSLLPPCVAEFSRELPPHGGWSVNSEVTEFALNRWRQLTAFLLNPERSERSGLAPKQEVSQQAQQLASLLDKFLGLFVEPQHKKSQESHLRSLILECTKFGYVVFSQPAELDFMLSSTQGLVTHPGLVAVRNEQGNKNNPPREVLAPTVSSV